MQVLAVNGLPYFLTNGMRYEYIILYTLNGEKQYIEDIEWVLVYNQIISKLDQSDI